MSEPFDFELNLPGEVNLFVSGVYDAVPTALGYRAQVYPDKVRGQDIFYQQTNPNLLEIKIIDFFSGQAPIEEVKRAAVEKINEKLVDEGIWDFGKLI